MSTVSLAEMRIDYGPRSFDVPDIEASWHEQLSRWLDEARTADVIEPNAMLVATEDGTDGLATRTVLCKGLDERGVVFFTNLRSAKSVGLDLRPRASATFPWYAQSRQVHVRGRAELVSRAEVETYWATRPRGSQLGAWASEQSSIVADRAQLDDALVACEQRFADVEHVPVPPHWGGWRIVPVAVEFWQGRTGRMHDRLCFVLDDGGWVVRRLAP